MKTRKLMAVLVMVAMIVTALPVVALAGDDDLPGYSAAASYVVEYDDKAGTGEEDKAEITLLFRKLEGRNLVPVSGSVLVWIEASHDAVTISPEHKSENKNLYTIKLEKDDEGEKTFKVSSAIPGDVTISFYTVKKDNDKEERDTLIDKVEINFEESKKDWEVEIKEPGDKDAGERFTLTAVVTDKNGWELEDKEVTFYERKGDSGSFKVIGKAKTNRRGQAELKISREKADTYYYYAKCGSVDSIEKDNGKKEYTTVVVKAVDPYSIKAKKEAYYVDADKDEAEVEFVIKDRYGNEIEELEGEDLLQYIVTNPDGDDENEENVGKAKFKIDIDDKGEYIVEARIYGTSISAKTKVFVGEFGEVEEIKMKLVDENNKKLDQAVIISDDEDLDHKVVATLVDVAGIEKDADEDVVFTTSDASLATVGRYSGELKVKKDASGEVTITAVHLETGVQGSITISIAGTPVSVDADVEADGLFAEVTLKYRDKDGNLSREADEDEAGYKIILPDGVEIVEQKDFKAGKATFELEAEEFGTYRVRVITDLGISKSFDVEFAEEVEKPAVGKVLLTLGVDFAVVDGAVVDLDAPAFIDDSRTFVPVRFLAETFGAVADWEPKDAATEVVTLTRDDMEIVIGIGDEFLTVTVDGDVEVQEFDGAARIVNDRTFLPFRAIGEAFGATVDYGVDEEGFVTWVSFD